METITLVPDKTNNILLIIVFLIFAAFGIMVSIKFHLLGGLFLAVISVLVAVSFLLLKVNSEPQLIIDESGIHDFRWGAGFIPWKDIKDGKAVSTGVPGYFFVRAYVLRLFLYDPEPYHKRFGSFTRPFVKFNSYTGLADIRIALSGLKGAELKEINAAIQERLAARDRV